MVSSIQQFQVPVRLRGVAFRVLAFIAIATALRLVLFFTHLDQFNLPITQFFKSMLTGLRFDVAVALLVVLPYALSILLLPARPAPARWRLGLRQFANFVFLFVVLYLTVVEFFFFDEFNARFNFVAVDYLLFPHEVFVNIWDSYPVGWALLLTTVVTYLLHRVSWPTLLQAWRSPLVPRQRAIWLGCYLMLAGAAFFSINISTAQISSNRVANELALNGYYSFGYSFVSNEVNFRDNYRHLSEAEALERTRNQIALPHDEWLNNGMSVDRHITVNGQPRPLNVVLILEESFGSEFSGLLHPEQGAGVTPEFDKVAKQSLLYSHIYASGNRTVRALEATLTSFVPIPGQSIVKRPGGENVFSLPALLKAKGYQTRFIYGGMGYFDNMAHFALSNGFQSAVDQTDFQSDEVSFTTIWGVCDEDLFNRSLKELDQLATQSEPFFTTILTVSNHKPYLYPEGRIAEDPKLQRRRHAVKYADFALGKFLHDAQQHAWFDNTLFVMLGDHGARVYGEQEIPISSYEIPVAFYAPKHIAPAQDDRLGAQIDIAPTIMGLLNLDYNSAFFGRDLARIDDTNRYALLSHNRDVALLRDSMMVVLGIKGSAHLWQVLNREGETTQLPLNDGNTLLRDTIAMYQTGYELFSLGHWRPLPQVALAPGQMQVHTTLAATSQ
ncbi:LTA synthase family protein [Permianibacter sp. IMCC34836]|uniref:LTA synthase family protein n=1 Tax=Permianibacter fluminis TaxID=2738515 RepID=UPI001554661B|nr:LTA synthase family protein [Permianibacter fluminis]NQD37775.1 LTA synthase family protein [Permianibacter fluminis]